MPKSALKIHVYAAQSQGLYHKEWKVYTGCGLVLTIMPCEELLDERDLAFACAKLVAEQVEARGWGEACLCENANGTAPCGTKPAIDAPRATE